MDFGISAPEHAPRSDDEDGERGDASAEAFFFSRWLVRVRSKVWLSMMIEESTEYDLDSG